VKPHVRNVIDNALLAWCPPVTPGHPSIDTGFIKEDKVCGVGVSLEFLPLGACLLDVRAVLFGGA
jgi:hypothetical protein